MAVDWSNLSKDLVEAIGEKLDSYADYLRYRAVCVEWNSSLPNKRRGLQPQKYPYLLLPPSNSQICTTINSLPHCALVNPLDGRVVDHLELIEEAREEIDKLQFRGCSKGWLIAIEKGGISIHLINAFPSSHDDDHHRLLPPITTFPDVLEYRPDKPGEEFLLSSGSVEGSNGFTTRTHIVDFDEVQSFFIQKVVLSSPPTDTNCIAMSIYGDFSSLAYCIYGGDQWTRVGGQGLKEGNYTDMIFYQDKFYAVDVYRRVKVIVISNLDSSSPTAAVTIQIATGSSIPHFSNLYLVVVDHNLFMLARHRDSNNENASEEDPHSYKTTTFDILLNLNLNCTANINSNQQQGYSTPKQSPLLHNHVLFLGLNESLSLPSHYFPQGNGGCIYFSDDYIEMHDDEIDLRGSDFGVFNFHNKTVQPVHNYEQRQLLWPSPIWVMRLNHC